MRSKSFGLLLLALAACGGSDTPAPPADGAVAVDSTGAAAAADTGKFKHPKPKPVMIDTGAVAPPSSLVRESYGYSFTSASRDPFRALNVVAVEGPELPDLRLVGLIYNHTTPRLSLATFRDIGNKKEYNVHPGDRIGRLQAVEVDSLGVTLRMNDFGTVREQTYLLRKEDGNQ